MSTAAQCREMGLKVGDTIEGMEAGAGWWEIARLTLLWIGETEAVFSETTRTDKDPLWSPPRESANWTLDCRDWRKVESWPAQQGKGGEI